jgi:hypothetical protein
MMVAAIVVVMLALIVRRRGMRRTGRSGRARYRTALASAQCIASDDLRLKEE